MNKITAMADGTKKSWARAKLLVQITGAGLPMQARKFLSANPEAREILDRPGKKDKRNRACREVCEAFENSLKRRETPKTEPRPSKGDPTKPVRAGAPTKRKYTKRGKPGVNPDNIAGQALVDLRGIQKKYGLTTNDLAYCTKVLGDLIDSPIDCDQFLKQCKE